MPTPEARDREQRQHVEADVRANASRQHIDISADSVVDRLERSLTTSMNALHADFMELRREFWEMGSRNEVAHSIVASSVAAVTASVAAVDKKLEAHITKDETASHMIVWLLGIMAMFIVGFGVAILAHVWK